MFKIVKLVKVICRKYDKFLCVEFLDLNVLFFLLIVVFSFCKFDIEQVLEKFLEIINNDEFVISRQFVEG